MHRQLGVRDELLQPNFEESKAQTEADGMDQLMEGLKSYLEREGK